jgi:outer membrane protein OmpA-like peptidoglycan-associated protein
MLERAGNPYASFASYRPLASGNTGPAPALPPVQGGNLDLMSLNLGLSYMHFSGEDRHPERGASFDKKMVEVLATGDFYFINLLRAKKATKSPKVSPFVRLGAGFGVGDPNTVNGNMDKKKANFALPMGLGFRVNISDKMALNLDYTGRSTFGDGLDGIASPTGAKDWYGAGGMGLSFMLGKKANDSDGDGFKNDIDQCPTTSGTLNGCPDTDGDGIADQQDTCPNEAGDQRFNGCPDSDGDGVTDNADDCPADAGLRRFAGCPDTDGDNIVDKEDNCPTVAGLAATNGCPDADKDGVNDDKDECPNDPGPAEQKGCPDTDNDGIVDSRDECPNTFGPARLKGCPDSDEDGLVDPKDKCPTLKGPASNEGCPEIEKADKLVLDKAMRNVKFRTGSAELLPASRKDLDQIAEVMSRYKGYVLSIDGYTDSAGSEAVNQSLSESRARACYEYLGSIGVRLAQMKYAGHGSTNPIGDNNTEAGRILNRRVTFTLVHQ